MKNLVLLTGAVALLLIPMGALDAQYEDSLPPPPLPAASDDDPPAGMAPGLPPMPEAGPAQGRRPSPEQWFREADADQDGMLSFEEFMTALPRLLPPPNRPGAERGPGRAPQPNRPMAPPDDPDHPAPDVPLPPGPRPEPGTGQNPYRILQRADKNNDGKVSLEEFQTAFPNAPIARFHSLDRNNDGVISEADALVPAGPPPGRDNRWRRLQEADTNKDGKIQREEAKTAFPNMSDEEFKRRDRNNNGFLDLEDFDVPGGPLE